MKHLLKQCQTETEAGFLNVGRIAVSISDTTRANYQLFILGDLSLNASNSDSNKLNFLLAPISSFLIYPFYPFHPFPQFVSPSFQYLFSLPTHLNYIFISFSLSFCYLYFALFHFFVVFLSFSCIISFVFSFSFLFPFLFSLFLV